MIRRSSGEVVRKENEINHMCREEFADWLNDVYKINEKIKINPQIILGSVNKVGGKINYIEIPLFLSGYKLYRLGVIWENEEMKEIDILASSKECEEFIGKLCEKFHITVSSRNEGLKITKGGKISNSICVEIIDTVMENTKRRIYDKVK